MSARFLPALSFLLLAGCAAAQYGQEPFPVLDELALYGRQVSLGAGLRTFTDDAFGNLDHPVALSLDYCEPMGLGRLRLEGGMHYTYDEADGVSGGQDVRLKGTTFELSAGLNYALRVGRLRPYAGAGASLAFLELRGIDQDVDAVFDDDDATGGGYAKVGLLFQLNPVSHVGFEVRHFEGGVVNLDGTDLDTDYDQFEMVFGTSFQ